MGIETSILGCYKRSCDRWHCVACNGNELCRILRIEVGKLHIGAILHEEATYNLTIVGINLGGEVALRILQLLE